MKISLFFQKKGVMPVSKKHGSDLIICPQRNVHVANVVRFASRFIQVHKPLLVPSLSFDDVEGFDVFTFL
jgi:hypothetical protein